VARQTDLTDGQKRLYERGMRWAGTNGAFWYSFDVMATELGKSPRQVKRDMAGLERHGLIQHERRGKRISNLYRFLYHPMFEGEVTSTAHHRRHGEVTDLSGEVTSTAPGDVPPAAHESYKENLVKESSSASVEAPPEAQPAEPTDDDPPSEKGKPKTNTSAGESQLAKAEANSKAAVPTLESRVSEANTPPAIEGLGAELVTGVAAPNPDREALIATAREQLRMARAQGLGIPLEQIGSPDRAITVQILEAFRAYDDFQEWLKDTVRRGLARKARDSRWGLYLKDAANHAEDIAFRREAEEKRRIDGEVERERQQAEARAAVAELDQPMPWLQAFGKTQYRVHSAGRDIPPPLKARLKRTGEPISPNELARQIFAWRRCAQCGDSGTIGAAVDKTLAFCPCAAGIEESCSKGADWPAQEMAHVHADAKSLLAAACHAVGCLFTADTIADSKVSDGGGVLEIRLPDGHFGVDQSDVRKAAERLKWQRRIVITGGRQQPQPAPAAKPEPAAPARPPITQADIDAELAKRRQKIPPQMEAGCDLAARVAAGGIQ
jgi:hypothetical protein